jgi:hypothetical protein
MINTIYIQKLRDLGFYSRCMDQMEEHGHKALFVNEEGRRATVTLAECRTEIKNINHDLMLLKTSLPREWTEHYKIVS